MTIFGKKPQSSSPAVKMEANILGGKTLSLKAGDKVTINVNGNEDDDLIVMVPSGKKTDLAVTFVGKLSDL